MWWLFGELDICDRDDPAHVIRGRMYERPKSY
jgi:hypothetical protein